MKKLLGFTLAEVLVTLGIIGVVAALTVPMLGTNAKRQGMATTLRSTVTDLETAFGNAIADQQAENIFGTDMWNNITSANPLKANSSKAAKKAFVNNLNRYLRINGADYDLNGSTYYTSKNINVHRISTTGKTGAVKEMSSDTIPIYLKNGAVMFIRAFGEEPNVRPGENGENVSDGGFSNAADVYIDVNGATAPNTIGRDIFTFYLTGNGELLPAGGRVIVELGEWSKPWQNNCIQGSFGDSDWGGWSCTGRLVENGYVFDY